MWRYAQNLVPKWSLACEERRRGCFVDVDETLTVLDGQADSPGFLVLDTADRTSAVTVADTGACSAALAKGRWSDCVRIVEHWDIVEHTSW